MSLFVSNPSRQNVVFHYRFGPDKLLASIEIPSGQQREIGQGFSREDIAFLIKQLEQLGSRDAAEAHGKMTKFTGLIYREGATVSEDETLMAHAAETETRHERSATQATRGALAFDRNANAQSKGRRLARVTEVAVEEQLPPGTRSTGNEVEFSMSVDPEGRSDVRLPA